MSEHEISESRLLYEVMQALGKHGAVYRTNSGSVRLPSGKYFRALPEGFADIMFIRQDGGACFVECKVKPNKPTDAQVKFIEKMRGLNCRAGIAYSVEDAVVICGLSIIEPSADIQSNNLTHG
jgi:hypothetical protein